MRSNTRCHQHICITVFWANIIVFWSIYSLSHNWGMLILEQIACGFSGSNLASQSINLHGDWIAREDYCNRDFAEQQAVAYSTFLQHHIRTCVVFWGYSAFISESWSQYPIKKTSSYSLDKYLHKLKHTSIFFSQAEAAPEMFDKPRKIWWMSQLSNFTDA